MTEVKTFNGHYYAKTNQRTSYDTIRVSAMNDNGYLAIPNSAAENNFIKSLVGGNTEAWIGVFDPNYARNYCYDNATCFFDDSRFKDVKGQTLLYKNWASYEPNNFVELTDLEDEVVVVSPLGENWVVMSGNTGQWYDVGNHKNSNQNPRKHVSIVEFDEKPICYLEDDGVTDTDFPERVCNTQVFDDNVANADAGTIANCLFDINGKEYCPQGLSDAASFWSYIDGDSFRNVTSVTDYAQGEYKEFTENVRDFMDGFSSTHNNTVIDYQSGSGAANVGTVIDYQSNSTSTIHGGGVIDYTAKIGGTTTSSAIVGTGSWWFTDYASGTGYGEMYIKASGKAFVRYSIQNEAKLFQSNTYTLPPKADGTTFWMGDDEEVRQFAYCENSTVVNIRRSTISNKDYWDFDCLGEVSVSTRTCPSGYTDNGTNCQIYVSYNMYSYSCPSGYTAINNGFSSFSKTDPDTSSINDYSLDDDVNSSIAPASNCKKTVTYSYYNYTCPSGYTVNDGGLVNACSKTDPNNTTNDETVLGQVCNSATPPSGNCTKIIPYTFYSYECSNGYTAIDNGLSTCNRTDSSGSLSQSCNSATPPANNCYKDISFKYYTYACPSGYSISNYGLTSCPKIDPNMAINNESYLDDNCNEKIPPVGNCSKNIEYAFYQYVCTSGTNEFNSSYAPVNSGLISCERTDADLVNTNAELGDSCNDSASPTNNCQTTSYTCNSEVREPVWINNKWQCSPYPCYGNNNMENLSQNVGTLDKDDDGWTEGGECAGTIYIFNGKAQQCRSSDKFFGLAGGGCCKDNKYALGLMSCNAEEKALQIKKENDKCHYIGEYCSKKINIGFSKICVRESKSYCCFNSTLGRIFAEQGREQLSDIDWGIPENPNCRGFTVEEFQRLDLSQMDLNEFTDSIDLPDVSNKQEAIVEKISNHINLIQ
jgi:conjugal transfer mating pair stabilization protein TraN